MKTKLVSLITCLWLCVACSKDDMPVRDEFVDPNFIELLHKEYKVPVTSDGKINMDDEMTQLRLKAIVNLKIYSAEQPIYDVTGIRNLVSLDYLAISCEIGALDVSDMKYLKTLSCLGRSITHLNIRNTPLLENLTCMNSSLTSLDLSGHPKLKRIGCADNKLTTLDLKGLPELNALDCSHNHLTTIDASGMKLDEWFSRIDCGRQTNENGDSQTVRLVLSESQREAWEDITESSSLTDVEVTFIP